MGEYYAGVINHIARLEALVSCAPKLADLVSSRGASVVEYEVDGGWSVGYCVADDKECSIQKNFTTGGSLFPTHVHEENSYYIILEGEGVVVIGDEEKNFKPRDCVVVPPGVEHSWYYRKHTRYIGITIPASKGYPSGKA